MHLRRSQQLVARHILAALGLGAGALIGLTACTSTVIVEGGQGGGSTTSGPTSGAGATGSGTGTGTGTGTPFTCEEPEFGELVYACIGQPIDSPCPSPAEAADALAEQLNKSCESPDPEFCGCFEYVAEVPCGPDPDASECCYYALMYQDEICEGRPFQVHGQARLADVASRRDWLAADADTPCLDGLDDATRRALADAWTKDGLFEHASIASFARFILELMAVGAPADLIADAQQALADEIRHAKRCFSLASAYAGEPVGPGSLAITDGLSERHDLSAIAVATAVEGCINETLATIAAHEAAAVATDPAAKATLQAIADDESRHAALAWRFVAWACERDGATRQAVAEAFRSARHVTSEGAAGPPLPAGTDHAALRAHGQLPHDDRRAVLEQAFADVVQPCAEAMLRATAPRAPRAPAPKRVSPALA